MVGILVYNKLVRDKIPKIIEDNGEKPIIRILSDDEYKKELEKKLLEELNEVISSNGEDRIEELSDMLEVMTSLAELEGRTMDDVVKTAKIKKKKRGGFDNRIYLIGVESEK